jgi:hypothetical protein
MNYATSPLLTVYLSTWRNLELIFPKSLEQETNIDK